MYHVYDDIEHFNACLQQDYRLNTCGHLQILDAYSVSWSKQFQSFGCVDNMADSLLLEEVIVHDDLVAAVIEPSLSRSGISREDTARNLQRRVQGSPERNTPLARQH